MAVSYKRLWKLLVDKGMSKADLRRKAEIWDLYDENRVLLGKEHIRGEQMPIDGYHLVVHVRPYAFVENVVTHGDYRKKGYATACLDFAKKIADNDEKCFLTDTYYATKEEMEKLYEGKIIVGKKQ